MSDKIIMKKDIKIISIKGDPEDIRSEGYVCPKVVGVRQLYEDPDRSLPHGLGHLYKGTRMSVTEGRGVNLNQLTDPGVYDPITGNGVLSAISVEIEALTA